MFTYDLFLFYFMFSFGFQIKEIVIEFLNNDWNFLIWLLLDREKKEGKWLESKIVWIKEEWVKYL